MRRLFLAILLFCLLCMPASARFGGSPFNRGNFPGGNMGTGPFNEEAGESGGTPSADALQLETGDYMLQENGDFILLEASAAGSNLLLQNGNNLLLQNGDTLLLQET